MTEVPRLCGDQGQKPPTLPWLTKDFCGQKSPQIARFFGSVDSYYGIGYEVH